MSSKPITAEELLKDIQAIKVTSKLTDHQISPDKFNKSQSWLTKQYRLFYNTVLRSEQTQPTQQGLVSQINSVEQLILEFKNHLIKKLSSGQNTSLHQVFEQYERLNKVTQAFNALLLALEQYEEAKDDKVNKDDKVDKKTKAFKEIILCADALESSLLTAPQKIKIALYQVLAILASPILSCYLGLCYAIKMNECDNPNLLESSLNIIKGLAAGFAFGTIAVLEQNQEELKSEFFAKSPFKYKYKETLKEETLEEKANNLVKTIKNTL